MKAKLQIEAISKAFPAPRQARPVTILDEVSVDIAAGEFVTIVGPSGCGKTTLLRIAAGLVPPTGGRILLDGEPVTGPGFDRAFVFQRAALFPWRTVLANVAFGLEIRGEPSSVRRERALELLRLVGLTMFADYYPFQVSGGMQQRANLARALAVNPEILLMDEPFAALDAQTREIMQRELLKIWSAERKTVLFVTHQIDEAVYLADRVVVMSARPGRIKRVMNIDLPAGRDIDVKRTTEFLAYSTEVWDALKEEVEATMSREFRGEDGRRGGRR